MRSSCGLSLFILRDLCLWRAEVDPGFDGKQELCVAHQHIWPVTTPGCPGCGCEKSFWSQEASSPTITLFSMPTRPQGASCMGIVSENQEIPPGSIVIWGGGRKPRAYHGLFLTGILHSLYPDGECGGQVVKGSMAPRQYPHLLLVREQSRWSKWTLCFLWRIRDAL